MQLHESLTAVTAPGRPVTSRAPTIGFYTATIVHVILGLFWVEIVLLALDLRDCFLNACQPTTIGEKATHAVVWCLGGLTWAAVVAFVLTSAGSRRVFWGLSLSPSRFVAAAIGATWAILGSAQ